MSLGLRHLISGPAGAPCLVLAHAIATANALWRPQLPALSARFRVIALDLHGHGQSPVPDGPISIASMADDIAALLAEVAPAGAIYAGISTGGMVGQALALRHPGAVRALALCNTTSRVLPTAPPGEAHRLMIASDRLRTAGRLAMEQGMAAVAGLALERWFRPGFRERAPADYDFVRGLILATEPAGYAAVCNALAEFDLSEAIAAIAVPTLVIAGAHDRGTPLDCSQAIVQRIRGSRLSVIADGAHICNVEFASEFTASLCEFLETVRTTF